MTNLINVPEVYREYINPEKRTMPKNDKVVNLRYSDLMLSQKDAMEDFDTFKYLMDNVYSGRDYWSMHGVDFTECYAKIENKLKLIDYIPAVELAKIIHENFKGKIIDNHLSIIAAMGREYMGFNGNKYAYFSGVTVEKSNGRYIVAASENYDVKIGDTVECDDSKLYPTLSPHGKEYFYVGTRSWTPIDKITVGVNGEAIELPLHKSRAGEFVTLQNEYFKFMDCDGYPVVYSGTFASVQTIPRNCGAELGKSLRQEKNLLWVLAGNGGGSSEYPQHFIQELNGYANNATHVAWLKTHITDFSTVDYDKPYTEWAISLDPPVDYSQSQFDGNLYTIINSKTGSSAENAIGYAKCVKNNILIGENSCGVGLFGERQDFLLKNSLIVFGIPCKIFLSESKEGEGYTPDYWVDSADLIRTVTKWLHR